MTKSGVLTHLSYLSHLWYAENTSVYTYAATFFLPTFPTLLFGNILYDNLQLV
jgi:hypothetical protein